MGTVTGKLILLIVCLSAVSGFLAVLGVLPNMNSMSVVQPDNYTTILSPNQQSMGVLDLLGVGVKVFTSFLGGFASMLLIVPMIYNMGLDPTVALALSALFTLPMGTIILYDGFAIATGREIL